MSAAGCRAIGLSGADGDAVTSVRRAAGAVDYGYVGDIAEGGVNVELLRTLLDAGLTPVFSAITCDGRGTLLNTNADSVASAVAVAASRIAPTQLVFCFEKAGVLRDVEDERSVIAEITPDTYAALRAEGAISAGMLPKIDGFGVCELIRRQSQVPILMLTALDGEEQQLRGFRLDIDDYVTKPFSMPVLLEKIRVILRRRGDAGEDSRLRYRDLTLDLDTREALLDGQLLDLTAREFELLHTFLDAPGRVFTREMLLAKLWGYDFFGDERVVDSHIKNLRHKLNRDYIETVRGVGYRAAKEGR